MRRDKHRLRNLCDSVSANWINKSEDFTRRLAGRASLRQRVQTGTAGVVARAAIIQGGGALPALSKLVVQIESVVCKPSGRTHLLLTAGCRNAPKALIRRVNFIRMIEFLLTIAFIGIFIGPLVMSRAWVG